MQRPTAGACTGAVNGGIDIDLSYEPASNFIREDGSTYGGWNQNIEATAPWCQAWGKTHPCGTHPARVHLNEAKFGPNATTTNHYRRRLIMHETGHSMGLAHHCNSTSIMNDGTSGCNGGAWTNIDGYQATDHTGIRNIYPNWMYS